MRFATWHALIVLGLFLPSCGEDDPPPAAPADAGSDVAEPPPPPSPASSDAGGWGGVLEVDCPVGTTVELEDNDGAAKANTLDQLSFCGSISPGPDVDYSTFTTPENKKLVLFQGVIDGAVDFELFVNRKKFRPSEVSKFEAGVYVVKAFTKDKKPGKYRYRVQFEN